MNTVVDCWENQRWVPGKGWGTFRLPTDRPSWSDKTGKRLLTREGALLPDGWRWTNGWTVRVNDPKYPDGWLYAIDYTIPTRHCSHKAGLTTCVRRRCWVRSRTLETPSNVDVDGAGSSTALDAPTHSADFAFPQEHLLGSVSAGGGGDDNVVANLDVRSPPFSPHTRATVGDVLTSTSFKSAHAVHPREVMHYGFVPQYSQPAQTAARNQQYEANQHLGASALLGAVTNYFSSNASESAAHGTAERQRLPHLTLSSEQLRIVYECGVPQGLRSTIWMALSGSFERKRCAPSGHYHQLVANIDLASFWDARNEINLDVLRTCPQHPMFANGYGILSMALRRVLFALVEHSQQRYQQALSYLGALLLLNTDSEEDAFWLMVALVCDGGVLPDGYFTDDKLHTDLVVLQQVVEAHVDRRLAMHLVQNGLDVGLFANGWMQALLAAHVPPSTACRVLDIIFAEWSNAVVVRFVLAFLAVNRDEILAVNDLGSLGQLANSWARQLWACDHVFRAIASDGLERSVTAIRAKALSGG